MRAVFALLRKDTTGRIPQSTVLLLLRALTAMARHPGPTTFFNFANEGAGIMRNTPLRFPSKLCPPDNHACKGLVHQSVQQALR